jgi:prepilin-type N-terminal cleavage/methylation domain-containing protein
MTRTPLRAPRRRGFTLVEMMVVITIILVLVSLGAGAYLKVANYQQRNNTQTLVSKVDDNFHKKWRTVLDNSKTEQPNAFAVNLSMNDTRRAQVIHVLMCLRREFPTTFAEARNPSGSGVFGPNPAYARVLQSVNDANYSPEMQSSVCLYLALKEDRRGVTFDPDTALSSQEAADAQLSDGTPAPITGAKAIYDAWRNPVIFNRWPAGGYGSGVTNSQGQQVGGLGPFNPQAPADTEDPEGVLTDATWQAWLQTNNLVGTFNRVVGYPLPPAAGQQYRLTPVILSLGRNNRYDPTDSGSDDIYNFRLTPLNQ